MAKGCCSYVAPCFAICTIAICDYAFCIFQATHVEDMTTGLILEIIFYNLLALMSVWSLLMALFTNPGYVPQNYDYSQDKLSKTTLALY